MTLRILPDIEQRSEEWFEQRRGMVTASVVGRLLSVRSMGAGEYDCEKCGAVAGSPCLSLVAKAGSVGAPIKTMHAERLAEAEKNKHTSPPVITTATGDDAQGLTLTLAAERITGYTDPTYMTDDMWRGVEDEPRAIDVYTEHYAPVQRVGFMVRNDYGFDIGYSPDGLVGEDGLIEVKSRRQKKQLSTILSGEVPLENMAQLQCGLLVSRREWCDYISYSGGMRLWKKRVLPDPLWFEAIIAAVETFERNAAEMVATYNEATADLPMTERVPELEMVI